MFTASDDDWQSYVPRIFPSRVWRNFRNRCQGHLCYVILISPAISYCDFVWYMKVTCFISVVWLYVNLIRTIVILFVMCQSPATLYCSEVTSHRVILCFSIKSAYRSTLLMKFVLIPFAKKFKHSVQGYRPKKS
jgi:hypothetical protein